MIDLGGLRRAHQRLMRDSHNVLVDEARYANEYAAAHVASAAPFKNRTGAIRDSMAVRVVKLRSGVLVRLHNDAPHADFIDRGTRPHMIYPRKPGGILFFYWAKIGSWVRLRKVHHPGNRPYRFMAPARDSAARKVLRRIEQRLSMLAHRL